MLTWMRRTSRQNGVSVRAAWAGIMDELGYEVAKREMLYEIQKAVVA